MTKKHTGLNHSKSSHDRRIKENAPKSEAKQALATPSIISAASFRSVANLNRNKTNMVVMKVMPTNKPSNHSKEHKEQQKDSLKSKSYAFGSESSLTTSSSSASNHAERKHDVQANNCTSSSSKRLSFSNENMSFMNSVLAQIGV